MDVAPYHQEILDEVNAQAVHPVILHVLGMRFGPVPKDVADVVRVT